MKQINKSHYDFQKYMHMARWSCYYIQIKEVLALNPQTVLEIGPGDGLFGWYVQKNGISYTSCDHADDISSNAKANLGFEPLPFADNSFDVVCAFQVLEHIPFDKVPMALSELSRVSKKFVALDIPQYSFHFQFVFKVPLLPYISKHFVVPRPIKNKFDGFHYWEISKKGFSVKKVRNLINEYFNIKKEFSIVQNPKERFYILKNL